MSRLPSGVVFDCDGTLADTESLSDRSWSATLRARGYEPTAEDFRAVVGHPYPDTWGYFAERADLGDPVRFRAELRARFVTLFDTELEVHEDAVGTLRTLAARGVPIGVASSSSRASVLRVLARAEVTDLVRVVVGIDDVHEPKPAAEPYLRAARGLGVEPQTCTAVEDTPVGVSSARAAGMFTVAVVRAHGDRIALAEADRVVDEVTLSSLSFDRTG